MCWMHLTHVTLNLLADESCVIPYLSQWILSAFFVCLFAIFVEAVCLIYMYVADSWFCQTVQIMTVELEAEDKPRGSAVVLSSQPFVYFCIVETLDNKNGKQ